MALEDASSDVFEKAQSGDPVAFEELIRPHLDSVRRFVFSLSSNWQDADDITQEALIKAFRAFAGFDRRASLSTWLYTVARSASVDWHRSRSAGAARREDPLRESHPAPPESQEEAVAGKQAAERLWSAIHGLDERYRVPVVLFEIEGLTYEEIAAIEQVPVGTVRSRLSRGREQLRDLLRAEETSDVRAFADTARSGYPLRRSHG